MHTKKTVTFEPCGPVSGKIRPPGSKSITNRAIICAALADGNSQLAGVLDSDDTRVMIEAWRNLGLSLEHDADTSTLQITGCGGQLAVSRADLFIGNSGTSIRFLTAALAACVAQSTEETTTDGDLAQAGFALDGVPRMRQRPIGDLLDALQQLGGVFERLNDDAPNCPPVSVFARGIRGGRASIRGNISSQFLSGLMMAAPLASGDVELAIEGELVSVPYVEMTADVMRSFGAAVHIQLPESIEVESGQPYQGTQYDIEPDASAASYFWAAAAITGGCVRVEGLHAGCLQGDVKFVDVLKQMGCDVTHGDDFIEVAGTSSLTGVDVDMGDISDTVQTLAAVALFADGPTRIRNVAHNRVKETDRISDLATELRKLGAEVEEYEDGFTLEPPKQFADHAIQIATYDDHRMAMSLSLVGLRVPGVVINDPACTGKTYPGYWQDMERLAGCGIRWGD